MDDFKKVITPARLIYLATNGGEFEDNIYHLLTELIPYFENKGETFKNSDDLIGRFICVVLNNYDTYQQIPSCNLVTSEDHFLHTIFWLVTEVSNYRGYIANGDARSAANATRNIIGYALDASGFEHELTNDEKGRLDSKVRKYKDEKISAGQVTPNSKYEEHALEAIKKFYNPINNTCKTSHALREYEKTSDQKISKYTFKDWVNNYKKSGKTTIFKSKITN